MTTIVVLIIISLALQPALFPQLVWCFTQYFFPYWSVFYCDIPYPTHFSYTHYNERQISITDVLSLALSFVKDQTSWEYDRGGGVEEKDERQAEKRARVSLYPSPRYCSQQEQDVLGACLTRWGQELHQEMDGESMSLLVGDVYIAF